jgi:hypothetical protein
MRDIRRVEPEVSGENGQRLTQDTYQVYIETAFDRRRVTPKPRLDELDGEEN